MKCQMKCQARSIFVIKKYTAWDFGKKISNSLLTLQPDLGLLEIAYFAKSCTYINYKTIKLFQNFVSSSRLRWKIELPIKKCVSGQQKMPFFVFPSHLLNKQEGEQWSENTRKHKPPPPLFTNGWIIHNFIFIKYNMHEVKFVTFGQILHQFFCTVLHFDFYICFVSFFLQKIA